MEEVNEMALSDIVTGSLIGEDYNLQDKGFSQDEAKEIDEMRMQNRIADINNISIKGKNLKRLREICVGKPVGTFEECLQEYWNMKLRTAQQYERAYNFLLEVENIDDARVRAEIKEKIDDIGVRKMNSLYGIPEELRKEVLQNAPIEKMGYRDVAKLSSTVKEKGEYNEDLLNEIKQKDDKIKTTEAKTKQLQQEKEQKDQEIAELKAKLQKMEEEKVQPVGSSEPEVVEKIVEVEKVVEKEVVPDYINQEIEQKEELIEKLTNQVEGLNDALSLFKNQEKLVKEEAFKDNDWDKLCSEIGNFVRKSAQYTFLETDYINLDSMYQKRVLNSLNKIENWLLKMKQITNQNLTIGNVIYSDVDFEESEE